MNKYEDMLHLPRPVSKTRQRMSTHDRAAQFAPFAALTGYDAAIFEAGRLTECRPEPAGEAVEALDRALRELSRQLWRQPGVQLVYFRPDGKKSGGRIVHYCGVVRKLLTCENLLLMADGTKIPVEDLLWLSVEM